MALCISNPDTMVDCIRQLVQKALQSEFREAFLDLPFVASTVRSVEPSRLSIADKCIAPSACVEFGSIALTMPAPAPGALEHELRLAGHAARGDGAAASDKSSGISSAQRPNPLRGEGPAADEQAGTGH